MTRREFFNWFGTGNFIVGTMAMISPHVAAVALFPWAAFLIGNVVWLIDSIYNNQRPWIFVSTFFIFWDSLLLASRIWGSEVLAFLQPLIIILEMLP